jgi:hypothetical protein
MKDDSRLSTVVLSSMILVVSLVKAGWADDAAVSSVIDEHIRAAWKTESIEPAVLAKDAEFLRRIYLDLVGTVPTFEETVEFLDSYQQDKRRKLIDRLLSAPRFARHQANVWDSVLMLRNPPRYDARTRPEFRQWLRDQFEKNVKYDVWARKLIEAGGNSVENGESMYLIQYSGKAQDTAVSVTRLFLGIQVQCARCHDHPFDDFSQRDFYGMSAFFARLQVVSVGKKNNRNALAVGERNLGDILFTGPQIEQKPGQKGEPVAARFLKGEVLREPELPENFKEPRNFPSGKMPPPPRFSRKDKLAEWIVRPDNPYFRRAIVNRLWAQYMGRGLVHPVDNLSPKNPPSHPELLDSLAQSMLDHKFDLKWFIRELVNSDTYQLGSVGSSQHDQPLWFERARVRPLTTHELLDSFRIVTGFDAAMRAAGQNPEKRLPGAIFSYMDQTFGATSSGTGEYQASLKEHLFLNNASQLRSLIRSGTLLKDLSAGEISAEEKVERLFLTVLSRRPSAEENKKFVAYLSNETKDDSPLEEAIWTLLTCSEFRFNH